MKPRSHLCTGLNSRQPKTWHRLLVLLGLFLPALLAAQGSWLIYSPAENGTVADGELVISLRWEGSHELDPRRTFLVLDKTNLSNRLRVQGKTITLFHPDPVGEGRHRLTVLARDVRGTKLPPVQWSFKVKRKGARQASSPQQAAAPGREPYWQLTGTLDSRFESLDGPGAGIRQEPNRTLNWQVEGEAGAGKWEFPLRLWLTSDESGAAQPRNRFRVGAVGPFLEAYFGDNNPVFQELMLNGNRVRGLQAGLHLAGIHLEVVHGEVQRAVQGQVLPFRPGAGLQPPPNLQRDSTFVVGGAFRRRLSAARLSFGSRQTARLGLTALKARDDTSSARAGQTPMDNVVVGGDLTLNIPGEKNHLVWESAAALSLTTRDISTGASSKAEIDSLFGVDFPFDPQDYASIIILNTTTFPVEIQKGSSLAYYTRLNWRLAGHALEGEYRYVGPAYRSLGNPFLRTDRRGYVLSDRFHLAGRKLQARVSWEQFRDNQRNTQLSTRRTDRLFTRFQLSLSPRAPRILLGVRWQRRKSLEERPGDTDETLWHWTGGLFYQTRLAGWNHQFQLTYNFNDRKDRIRPQSGTRTHHLMVGVSQNPTPAWLSSLTFQWLQVNRPSGPTLFRQLTLGVGLSHRWPSRKGTIGVGGQYVRTPASSLLPGGNRIQFQLQGSWQIIQGVQFHWNAGYNRYRDEASPENRFSELYIVLRQSYALFR
ncbi:MAG: hypothetical protein D6715_09700 [Calditrichaeota bacterium]|nr:MAG: hypothetical protein D6715_09700 [Calditrichota bacterium]